MENSKSINLSTLPENIENQIFYFAAINPHAQLIHDYKERLYLNIDVTGFFDFDFYMKKEQSVPIPYSYYRDITYLPK